MLEEEEEKMKMLRMMHKSILEKREAEKGTRKQQSLNST